MVVRQEIPPRLRSLWLRPKSNALLLSIAPPVAADGRGVCELAQDGETALVAFGQLLQRVNTRTYSPNKRILLLSSDLKAEDLTQKGETALVACIHINRCLEGSIIPHVLGKFFWDLKHFQQQDLCALKPGMVKLRWWYSNRCLVGIQARGSRFWDETDFFNIIWEFFYELELSCDHETNSVNNNLRY